MESTVDMGVYDFFKGECPGCDSKIDKHPIHGDCGDIQTKHFICTDGDCFREFYPGQRVPFAPATNLVIGRTCCCDVLIKAVFDHDLLMGYHLVVGKEKHDYLRREMQSSYSRRYVPETDRFWLDHRTKWENLRLEESVIRAAMHPTRLRYYLEKGYSIEDVCQM